MPHGKKVEILQEKAIGAAHNEPNNSRMPYIIFMQRSQNFLYHV
jgi:hypothetical protein